MSDTQVEGSAPPVTAVVVREDEERGVQTAYTQDPELFRQQLELRGENRQVLMEWIRSNLKEGVDYHRIKGKDSLGKTGAEKVLGMLGWVARWPELEGISHAYAEPPAAFMLRCHIFNQHGECVGEGAGARSVSQDKGDLNKALKMCKKAALVDAVLSACGLSEVFTQDIEEGGGGGDYRRPAGNSRRDERENKNYRPDDQTKISMAQVKRLWTIARGRAKQFGDVVDAEEMVRAVIAKYEYESTRDIVRGDYEDITQALEGWLPPEAEGSEDEPDPFGPDEEKAKEDLEK